MPQVVEVMQQHILGVVGNIIDCFVANLIGHSYERNLKIG